jgi:hypothetical protein
MALINKLLVKKILRKYRALLGYYPDILFYKHNQRQYQDKLNSLVAAKYIYANGYDLRRVGIITYFFQWLKGLIGLTNYCQEQKIQLSLQKFVYYGYLRGYQQNNLDKLEPLGLSLYYRQLVSQPRNDQTSALIQQELINSYIEKREELQIDESLATEKSQISSDYVFGSTLKEEIFWKKDKKKIDLPWQEIPALDPQNEQLIAETAKALDVVPNQKTKGVVSKQTSYNWWTMSKYAFGAAKYYVDKAKVEKAKLTYGLFNNTKQNVHAFLEKALNFNKEIYVTEINIYIEYYLEKDNRLEALRLIGMLVNASENDNLETRNVKKQQALTYINMGRYSKQDIKDWVIKDSQLACVLSNEYLAKERYSLEAIEFVTTLHTPTNFSAKYPVGAFKLLLSQQKWDEAYKLFSAKKATTSFAEAGAELQQLVEHFNELGNLHYKEGLCAKTNNNWESAKVFHFSSLIAKKKVSELEPKSIPRQDSYFRAKCLTAQLMIEHDKKNYSAADCQIAEIIKAINLVKEDCNPHDKTVQKARQIALANGLMRKADYLITEILVPNSYKHDHEIRKKHAKDHVDNFRRIIETLTEITTLLAKTTDSKLKLILGKAYFLLGDIKNFFQLPNYNLHSYRNDYFKAMEAAPKNPWYMLRCNQESEGTNGKLSYKAVELLKAKDYQVCDWMHWDDDNWYKDKIPGSNLKDIHWGLEDEIELPTEKKSIFSFN